MLRIHSLCVKSPNPTRRTACECDFCQPEVQNLGVAALRHEYVCGLDVPVDDAFCVSCVEFVGNLRSELLASVTFASPKSRILAWPRFVTNMFAGLMSRWTMPSA